MLSRRAGPTLEVVLRVFVSCAPADRALAEQVTRELSGAGFHTWFDADASGAEPWWQRSADAVSAADAFVTLWTSNLAAARPATALLHYAGALGKPVVAVQSEQVDRPPATYGLTFPTFGHGDPALPSAVRALVQQAGAPPTPTPTPAPPPPWPFAYLTSLRDLVAAPVLPGHDQQHVLARLQTATAEDGQYPAVREGAAQILTALRARPDLDPAVRPHVDALAPRTEPAVAQQDWIQPAYALAPQSYPPQSFPPQSYPPHGYPAPPPGYSGYPPPPRSTRGRTIGIVSAVAVLVIVALVAGTVLLIRSEGSTPPAASGGSTPGRGADDAGVQLVDDGILVGSGTAPVTVDVFNDAMCPACGDFIGTYGGEIRDALLDNKIQVRYHLINMLDGYSASGDYSTRAAAAVYCVAADTDVATFEDFYSELFDPAFQPEEGGTSDHTDDDLADLAVEAGAPESAADCIAGGAEANAAAQRTDEAYATLEDLGGDAVPSVFQDGTEIDIQDPAWIDALTR